MTMGKWSKELKKQLSGIGKFKYAALVLVLGIFLMSFPFEKKETVPVVPTTADPPKQMNLADELEEILSKIDGAGEVDVLLSMQTGTEYTYQQNTTIKTTSAEEERQSETVVLTQDGQQTPVETLRKYPTYRGAVVVCQGADRASVKLSVISAVSSLTGLRSDDITVVKMKGK